MKILSVMYSVVYAHECTSLNVLFFVPENLFLVEYLLRTLWEKQHRDKDGNQQSHWFQTKKTKENCSFAQLQPLGSRCTFISLVVFLLTSTARNFNYFRNWAHL